MKKKYRLLFLLILSVGMLTGCSDVFINMQEKQEVTDKAREYLSKKYNIDKFDYKITKNNFYGQNKKCLDSCGPNMIKIKYKDKEYFVSYNRNTGDFDDTIQYEEIYQAYLNELKRNNGEELEVYAGISKENKEYFDGTNLKDVIGHYYSYIFYYSENYNELETYNFLKDMQNTYGGNINILYFKNKNEYNMYKSHTKTPHTFTSFESHWLYARYVDFYVKISHEGIIEKSVNTKIDLEEGLKLYAWDTHPNTVLEETTAFDLTKVEDFDLSGYEISSNYYKISSEEEIKSPDIIIDKNKCDIDECIIVTHRIIRTGEDYYDVQELKEYDEELYFNLPFSGTEFDFVILKKENKI